ncbi:MAG: alginate lyase family protein [Anaerolineaceae bacterium]|nr:alginate lyase family protein [Anaerolineaceae bacterium]
MMERRPAPSRIVVALKAIHQLGLQPVALNVLYRFGLWSGHYARLTPPEPIDFEANTNNFRLQPVIELPHPAALRAVLSARVEALISEADEVVRGQVRLFGGPPITLELEPPPSLLPLRHWTTYEHRGQHFIDGRDIKFQWEPARFGWAYTLARAYSLTRNDGYAQAFWEKAERFLRASPPNLGPQWSSAQEVALRLMALVFTAQVFASSPTSTSQRISWLSQVVAAHARRIPPTLVYARAQNNNHLLSEAAGLLTAAFAIPAHPQAPTWRRLGWEWLNRAFQLQIEPDGTYVQHSANYHRLMLHLALWVQAMLRQQGLAYPAETAACLAAATRWLIDLVDPVSGQAPNLGSNDGANILHLTQSEFADYRPVLQAASRAFLDEPALNPGIWDELSLWTLGNLRPRLHDYTTTKRTTGSYIGAAQSWASLRAVHYSTRPSHSDPLHVEIWWRGINLARDAGSHLYNAPPPWDNALASTRVHNTVLVDDQEAMLRAGRFLWLDWAQAGVTERETDAEGRLVKITARHSGYRRLGVIHQRSLEQVDPCGWRVTDDLLPAENLSGNKQVHSVRLHWLLPDWDFMLEQGTLKIQSPYGAVQIRFEVVGDSQEGAGQLGLVRGGALVAGVGTPRPTLGWYSPTYGLKEPALSAIQSVQASLPIRLVTTMELPWNFE